jgi:hypothetical protein
MPANNIHHHHDDVNAVEVYRHTVATNHHVVYDIKVCVILLIGGAAIIACIVYILLQCRHKMHDGLLTFCINRRPPDDCKGLITDFDHRDSTENLLQTGQVRIQDFDYRDPNENVPHTGKDCITDFDNRDLLQDHNNSRTLTWSNDTPCESISLEPIQNLNLENIGKCSKEFYV